AGAGRPGRGARRAPRRGQSQGRRYPDRGRDTFAAMTQLRSAGSQLPRGQVTLLFTDIEGSTGLVQSLGPEYPMALGRHRDLLRESVERNDGFVLDALGDETSNVFADPLGAISAATEAQDQL